MFGQKPLTSITPLNEIIDEVYKYGMENYGADALPREEIERILPNSSYYKCIGSSSGKNSQLACIYDYMKRKVGGKSRRRRPKSRLRRRSTRRRR